MCLENDVSQSAAISSVGGKTHITKKKKAGFALALFPLFADTRRGVSISPLDYNLYV